MSAPKRFGFTLLASALALATLDLAGRVLVVDPRDTPQNAGSVGVDLPYDPYTRLVGETADGARHFVRGGTTFQPATWRVPRPQKGGYRIAVVGDSTVFGAFPEMFHRGLALPGTQLEVLNFGVPAIGSDRARIVVTTALQQDLDLLLVYVGHNDVLEARLNPAALEPFWRRKVRSVVVNGGIGRLLRRLVPPRTASAKEASADWRAREVAAVTPSDRAAVEAAYRANLTAICDAAKGAGVAVAFVEPISSLLHRPEVQEQDDPGFADQILVKETQERYVADPTTDFTAPAAALARRAPGSALAHYLAGRASLAAGDREGALTELRAARARDDHPWRATESMWTILRDVAAGYGAHAIATEPAFLADPRYLAQGDALFVDQVHPSAEGVVVLAEAVGRTLIPSLPHGAYWQMRPLGGHTPVPPPVQGFRPPPNPR